MLSKKKTYKSIVAPLQKMKQDLLDYTSQQKTKIVGWNEQKKKIDT